MTSSTDRPDQGDPAAWGVLADVREERRRQDARWGLNDHDDGTGPQDLPLAAVWQCLAVSIRGGGAYASELAAAARRVVRENDDPSWWSILFEEVAEASAEATPAGLRARLVKVAAVAVAWIESIDRREGAPLQAPGAVAAAPPGDEDRERYGDGDPDSDEDEVLAVLSSHPGDDVDGAMGAVGRLANAARRDWFGVSAVPPAGQEDEATVERVAIRLMAGASSNDRWFAERGAGTLTDRWAACTDDDRRHWREYARDVLAAARGPRTPDGPATN